MDEKLTFEINRLNAIDIVNNYANQLTNEKLAQVLNLFDDYKNFIVIDGDVDENNSVEFKVTSIDIKSNNGEIRQLKFCL